MFEALVICGGGAKTISTLGLLGKLQAEGHLSHLKAVSACSAGAYILAMYLLGFKPMEILEAIPIDVDLKWDVHHLLMFNERKGVFRIKRYTKKFRQMMKEKAKLDKITMKQFYEITKITFYIQTTDVDDKELLFISHETHPDLCLFKAIHASSSISPIFTPVLINGKRCVDGGLVTNLPIEPVKHLYSCVLDCSYDGKENDDLLTFLVNVFKTPAHIKKQEDLKNLNGFLLTTHSHFDTLDIHMGHDANVEEFIYGWNQYANYEKELRELEEYDEF